MEAFQLHLLKNAPEKQAKAAEVKFMSFAQRRFIGFRKGAEFDRKRLLMASEKYFKIFGFDINEKPTELLFAAVPENEKI